MKRLLMGVLFIFLAGWLCGCGPAKTALQLYTEGYTFQKKGELDDALVAYSESIEKDATLDIAYHNRGEVYVEKGEAAKAIDDYTRAIEMSPNNPWYYNSRGYAYYLEKAYIKSKDDYDKAKELLITNFGNPANIVGYTIARVARSKRLVDDKTWKNEMEKYPQIGPENNLPGSKEVDWTLVDEALITGAFQRDIEE